MSLALAGRCGFGDGFLSFEPLRHYLRSQPGG